MIDIIAGPYRSLLDIFFPKLCIACRQNKVGTNAICIECLVSLPYIDESLTPHPADQRLQYRFDYHQAFSLFYMNKDGKMHRILHQIKYRYRKDAALEIGEIFAVYVSRYFEHRIDAVLAVPIHRKKQIRRGYNQSHILAQSVSDKLNIPFLKDALVKKMHTPSQTRKTRTERIQNIDGSIALNEQLDLKDKKVLLIDDVLTTGSTLEVCGKVLRDIPGMELSIATLTLATDA